MLLKLTLRDVRLVSVQRAETSLKKVSSKQKARAASRRVQLEHRERKRRERRRAKRLGRTARHRFASENRVYYDALGAREQIILPEDFSLSTNYEATVEVMNRVRAVAMDERRPVMLHFNRVTKIEPAATLALASEIHRARHLRSPAFVTGTYPSDANVYQGLREMGFFRLLRVVEVGDQPRPPLEPGRPLYLPFISERRVIPEIPDHFVSIIEKHLFQMNDLARGRLVVAIKEAMSNTLDHAHPEPEPGESMKHRWWMSSWINLAIKEVTIVFFDHGVGIPKTIDPLAYERIVAALKNLTRLQFSSTPTDGEMIAAATEYHRSGKGDGRGRGFTDMKRFVDTCSDGELRVLSNRGTYHYMRDGREFCSNARSSLGGTIVEWRFRNDGDLEMKDG